MQIQPVRSWTIIGFLFVLLLCPTIKTQANELFHQEAIIHQANYHMDQFVIQVEIENELYYGKFEHQPSYEEYLFFHHNEGMIVNLTYKLNEDGTILIIYWTSSEK